MSFFILHVVAVVGNWTLSNNCMFTFCKTYPQSSKEWICCFMHILDNMDYKYGIKNEVLNVDANYIKMCLPNWVLKIRKELTSIFVKPFHHSL